MKRRKKTPKQKAKARLEKLVKDHVKERDNYTCRYCGAQVYGSNCHAAHVIPVSACGRLAFDPANLIVLCYHHHINWWHKNPTEAGPWFRDNWPETMAYLEQQKRIHGGSGSIPLSWYEERIASYEKQEGSGRLAQRSV